MRFALLAVLVLVGCGGSEPIAETQSPVGCWQSDDGRLNLLPTGQWQQTFNISPTTDSGSWSYDASNRELTLSITSASSSSGTATALWLVKDLTPTEMWTDSGAVTHWQSVTCQ